MSCSCTATKPKPKFMINFKKGWRLKALFRIENLLRDCGEASRAKRMGICGNTIRVKVHKTDKGNVLFQPSLRCKDRVCPVCNAYRASILARKVENFGLKMSNPHLLTVTASSSNRNDLSSAFEIYKSSIRAFKRNRSWFKKYVIGGIEHIEIVKKKDKGWHIHSHMLVDIRADRQVSNTMIQDGKMVVDPIKKSMEKVLAECGLGVISDIRPVTNGYGKEISKYALKIAVDTADNDLIEMIRVLKRRRMVSKFGSCYGTLNEDIEELTQDEETQYEDIGTVEDVVNGCFLDGVGIDRQLFVYVSESIRIGLIGFTFNTS